MGGGHKLRQSLLILWFKLQGMKNRDGNVSKKLSIYFHRIDTYCIINYNIKYIFTRKAVLIKAFISETFLVKGKVRFLSIFFYTM